MIILSATLARRHGGENIFRLSLHRYTSVELARFIVTLQQTVTSPRFSPFAIRCLSSAIQSFSFPTTCEPAARLSSQLPPVITFLLSAPFRFCCVLTLPLHPRSHLCLCRVAQNVLGSRRGAPKRRARPRYLAHPRHHLTGHPVTLVHRASKRACVVSTRIKSTAATGVIVHNDACSFVCHSGSLLTHRGVDNSRGGRSPSLPGTWRSPSTTRV